jgi:ariadne-1
MSDSDDWSEFNEYGDDYLVVPPELNRVTSYEVLEEGDIYIRQSQAIQKLSEEFNLEYSHSAVLLIQNDWNPHQVIEKILDSTIGLPVLCHTQSKSLSPDEIRSCPSCYSDFNGNKLICLDCEHFLCKNCYKSYLTESINQGVESIFTKCPIPECGIIVPQSHFKKLIKGPLYEKYKRFIFNSYVDNQKDVKWCPNSGCTNAAFYPKRKAREIICKCGYSWCFGCGNETHRPLSCDLLTQWINKLKKDDNQLWLLANTKPCPKCSNSIEKNEGCMHMTCKCGYEFCWLCFGDWKNHNGQTAYSCNKYQEERKQGKYTEKEIEKLKAANELKKFSHYYDRYLNHKTSMKAAQSKISSSKEVISKIYGQVSEGQVLDFYLEACELVYRSKLALSYTYAYGYFLESINKQWFFEFIQGELESNMIKLDEKLNYDLDKSLLDEDGFYKINSKFLNFRMIVVDMTLVLKKYFDHCLTQIENGLPDVFDEKQLGKDCMRKFDLNFLKVWHCMACNRENSTNNDTCVSCGSRRLDLN